MRGRRRLRFGLARARGDQTALVKLEVEVG